ncbi:unnamed protein product [Sphacelaria rigidula]
MPFNVVKQTARCCLCPHCYKGKLIMRPLVRMWPRLHCGETAGSPCTCRCDLCANGGCRAFLPTMSVKDVHSMGVLCDKLLCEKVKRYKTTGGSEVTAHLNTCVMGSCGECDKHQRRFFDCPRHRQSAEDVESIPDIVRRTEMKWEAFVPVDEKGNEIRRPQRQGRHPRANDDNDGDESWEPQGTGTRTQSRLGWFCD